MSLWKFTVFLLIILKVSSLDPFDDQPKILVNDGNLILESADSKNVAIKLKGRSRFLVNGIDILSLVNPSNDSSSSMTFLQMAKLTSALASQVNNLKSSIRSQSARIERLEQGMGPNSAGGNYSPPTEKTKINRLTRRITILEQKVANLTAQLTKDHCKSYPCQNGGTCFNMLETFRCECTENWEGPTCSLDVNECAKYVGTDLGCQNGATCINTVGSYECSCTEGWKGKNCNRRKVDCLSVPQSETCGNGICIPDNNKDGYSCVCNQGWRKDNNTRACTQDIDECNEMRPHCSVDPKVVCINTPGSFVCGPCPEGYTGNGFTCADVNECETNNGGCSMLPKVQCINTKGSSHCGSCPFGYTGNGKVCTPTSSQPSSLECADSSICNRNALCVQYPNLPPKCLCKYGFTGNGFGENGCEAVALDPCQAVFCRNGGTCVRNGTTAYCDCPPGTDPPLCNRYRNPCAGNPCLNGGNCTAAFRSYRCTCPRGFSGNRCQNQASTCGGVRTDFNGTIRYPEDPAASAYRHNSRCAWLIKTNVTKVLNITFNSFNIEFSQDCRFDWLQIHDGRTAASQLIGRFCGNKPPKGGNFISTHNQLYLWFRSDNSTSHDGFELTWTSINPVCGGELNITSHGTIGSPGSPGNYPMNSECEWILFAPPGKRIQFLFYTLMIESHATCDYDYLEIHSGIGQDTPSLGKFCNSTVPSPILTPGNVATIHFHSDADSSDTGFQIAYSVVEGVPGCGGVYTASKGDISSPINIADGKYKHNLLCDYVIRMPLNSRVRLEFAKFDLEDSANCKFDRIEVYEGDENKEDAMIGRYCGTHTPPAITSLTNLVTIKFITDWSSSEEGFQIKYTMICGGIFTSETGNISSPNYPNSYDGDRSCEYDIVAPAGRVIMLNVSDFEIEQHSICEFDYLQVFDGASAENSTSLGRFCGNDKPGTFTSTYNHLHIHFSSDGSIFGRGFFASYSFIDVGCGGIIRDATEMIKAPMESDGNGVYQSNAECRWLIQAPKGFIININILNFELEGDANCKYDYIKIFNNGSGGGQQIGPFCGTNVPKLITTSDNLATVLFVSDSSTAKDGFTFGFNFVDATKLCGGKFYQSHGTISSPGKPDYLPNKDCEWTITVPNGQQIDVKFNYFDMELHAQCKFDGLEIRNGGNNLAPLLGKFCGQNTPPPFKSLSNQLYFHFYSDSSRTGKGFEIEYDATTFGCGGLLTQSKGAIISPNYPESYSHNAQCEWRISVNEGSSIEIIFSDLDMESHAECKYDYLEIFDGVDTISRSFGKLCSSEHHPMHLETTSNHALIRMNTDESHSGRGFHIKYSTNCNRTIEANTGVLESLNFPEDYPHNLDCAWTIKVAKGNKINMQFSHFFLENENQYHNETNEHLCKFDYVIVYDYNFEEKSALLQTSKTYCNKAPDIRTSTTDSVVILFHTDQAVSGMGFRMEWYNEGCGGKLMKPEGSLTSPNYPERYNHKMTCIWEIEVTYGYNINVTIYDLDMEREANCAFDYLLLAHDSSFNDSITKICTMIHSPHEYRIDGHKLFVKFESDESHSGKGFNMSYKAVLADCGGQFFAPNGIIKTNQYPTKNYDNNKTCEWNIKTDLTHSLTFQLLEFDLEASDNCTKDYVEIIDSVFNEVLWKGCGSQLPNTTTFKSKRNELTVRLVTDGTINARGFKGNYSISCGTRIVTNDTGEIVYKGFPREQNCEWSIIAWDPSKHVTLSFKYLSIFFDPSETCFAKVEIYEGDSSSLGPLKAEYCGDKIKQAIISNGNALTVKLNTTVLEIMSEFDIHYSVMDNACGGVFDRNIHGEFASPNYPDTSPLNSFCEWTISASQGNLLSLNVVSMSIASSPGCNENYLEIRKNDANGELIGVYCSNNLPETIPASRGFWIKYKTDETSRNPGFLAEYKHLDTSDLIGASGFIESPNYPYLFRLEYTLNYRVSVKQGSVIRLNIIELYMDEDDPEDCMTFLKIFNGYDDTAPVLVEQLCKFTTEPITSEANVIYIQFFNSYKAKTKFKLKWNEVDRNITTDRTVSICESQIISLNNASEIVNITSPGYPNGYENNLNCEWTIESGLPSYRPIISFIDVDLEDQYTSTDDNCLSDYVKVSRSLEDGEWKEVGKVCSFDIRDRKVFTGTPRLKVEFHSDYYSNKSGFSLRTFMECGGALKDSDGIIEFDEALSRQYRADYNCMWNITVKRGKKIQFEFLELKVKNASNGCSAHIVIKNGQDNESPYLGDGQYCNIPENPLPLTSSNRGFVKYISTNPVFNSFKLRYYEVSHDCGGQIRLTSAFASTTISSPNYPNIPPPHIECKWTIIAPVGEQIKVDFLERFDLQYDPACEKEYVEIRDGSTSVSNLLGSFCGTKPATLYSKSNIIRILFFTDLVDPHNGFKANVSIGICGGTINAFRNGYLMSKKYPALGAYPNNVTCDYRVVGSYSSIFNIDIVDIDLPSSVSDIHEDMVCNKSADYVQIFSIVRDSNSTEGESLFETGTYCGSKPLISAITTESNEFLVRFKTFPRTKETYKGFKIFYNSTRLECGGNFNQNSGYVTSVGYPSKTLKKGLCEWRITVQKGKRVKIEFEDLDLVEARPPFYQRIGFYNDFRYHNRIGFVVNNTQTTPIYSTDNQMMIVFVVRFTSLNRGFKIKFSSDENTVCAGSLNDDEGSVYLPITTLDSFSCTYDREGDSIIKNKKDVGTIAFYFKDLNFGPRAMRTCKFSPMGITLTRISGQSERAKTMARICSNQTSTQIILSNYPDVRLILKQSSFFGRMNFTLQYKIHNCGGILKGSNSKVIKNPPADVAAYQTLDCGWLVIYEEEASVALTIAKLDLKLACEQEYINVYNGPTQMSPKITTLCGKEFNQIPIIASSTIFIEYHTDKFNTDSKNSVFELKTEMTTFGCGGILNKFDDSFSSPSLGQSGAYPPNTECIWELRASDGFHIGLTFVGRFFIEDSPNCTKDYIEFYDWINDDWSLMQRVCGRTVPKPVNSTATRMKVIFHSDATINGDGFNATWAENCGGIIEVTERRQILSSPNYPRAYSPDLKCNYTFKSSVEESFVNLKFLDFELEKVDSRCIFDNVTLFRYFDHTIPPDENMVGVYCGIKNPGYFRYKKTIKIAFSTDRWIEKKGFQIEYYLDSCGGEITSAQSISSPPVLKKNDYEWLGSLTCQWNITAKVQESIVIKFDKVSFDATDYCSMDFIEIFNGTNTTDGNLLAKICSNITDEIRPIVITNQKAVIKVKLDQTNVNSGFKATIKMQKRCDEKFILTKDKPSFILDKTKDLLENNLECSFVFIGDPLSVLKVTILEMHLSICDPDVNKKTCDCDYLEFLDGKGPFSPAIGSRKCGHNASDSSFTSTGSGLYIRLSTDGIRQSTGFKLRVEMQESPCGPIPYLNLTSNATFTLISPRGPGSSKYPPNTRCMWVVESDYRDNIEIIFNKFQLEDTVNCANDSLKIEDDSVKNYVTEGLGETVVYRGDSTIVTAPYFYSGVNGPTAPHIYCGSKLPHDYYSRTSKIRIYFESNSVNEFEGFELTVKTIDACSRNYTALQGRLVSSSDPKDCRTTITVPENYTISLYFYRFHFYETNCDKASMKIYDGDFATGALLGTLCGYTLPDPIFSAGNQLSIAFSYGDTEIYMRGNYDILYVASDKKDGCGGEIFNYGGMFTSPLYPNTNRTNFDCTWTIKVPQNLKVALKFAEFDMGSKLLCENDYVEILEENEANEFVSIKSYCGEDQPAIHTSSRSTLKVHHKQTLHFSGNGWIIHFMGVYEGATVAEW